MSEKHDPHRYSPFLSVIAETGRLPMLPHTPGLTIFDTCALDRVGVLWDEDDDTRAVWALDRLLATLPEQLARRVVLLGESQATVSIVLAPGPALTRADREHFRVVEAVPDGDVFSVAVSVWPTVGALVVERVYPWLYAHATLWGLLPEPPSALQAARGLSLMTRAEHPQ